MVTPAQTVVAADHHFVPRFYLNGFAKDGVLWVYEKGQNAPRASKPKFEGHRENYYTHNDRGYPDDAAEKAFARMESDVAPVVKKLARTQVALSEDERDLLYTFVAFSYIRVPAYREFIDKQAADFIKRRTQVSALDKSGFHAMLRDYEEKNGESVGDYEKLRLFAANGGYKVTQKSEGFNIGRILRSGLLVAEILEAEYHYDVYHAPAETHFMTGDNPVVTIEPSAEGKAVLGTGFGRPRTQVIFPLSKRSCLILSRRGREQRQEASPKRTRQVNDMIMAVSRNNVYGPVGTRRIARIFNALGGKVEYGRNAFMPNPPRV